jgi:hypothetical protein
MAALTGTKGVAMLRLLVVTTMLIATTAPIAGAPLAGPERAAELHTARVRAADSRSASLLVQGLERSATLRRLVERLELADVIVYVEMQPSLKRAIAGTLTWMTATKTRRYVRISINPELSTDAAIATLGHELQHAFEVAEAPQIIDATTLARYYAAHGEVSRVDAAGWDTVAARLAGNEVRRELAMQRTTRVADSIQQFELEDWLIVYRRARGMLPP